MVQLLINELPENTPVIVMDVKGDFIPVTRLNRGQLIEADLGMWHEFIVPMMRGGT